MGRGKKQENAVVVSNKFTVDNRIIKGKYGKLTDTEFRLVFTLIAKIKKDDTDFHTYEYTTAELMREVGIGDTNHTYIHDVLGTLFEKKISIPDGKGGYTLYHWLETATYDNETKKISIRFNNDLKPFLIQLQNRFTQIGFQYFSILANNYNRRIYMFCKEGLGVNYGKPCTVSMTFDDMRDILELPKYYESNKYIKRDILTPAIEDINERTDIKIALDYIKSGRTYTGIKILTTSKKAEALPALPAPTTPAKLSPEYILQYVDKAEFERDQKGRASRIRKFLKLPVWEQKFWTNQEESDMFKSPLLAGVKNEEHRRDLLLGFASLRWWEDKKAKAAKKKEEKVLAQAQANHAEQTAA